VDDLSLVVISGAVLGERQFPIRAGYNMIGRGDDAAIQLYAESISRRHALLTRAGGRLTIEDKGSASGTYVNGQAVTGQRVVQPGDVVQIGGLELLVVGPGMAEARRVPPVRSRPGVPPPAPASPTADTRPGMPLPYAAGHTSQHSDHDQAGKAPRSPWSAGGLTINVVSSGAAALILSALQISEIGTASGSVLAAIVTSFVTTNGRRQWLRILGAAGAACLIAAVGITLPEIALGRAITAPDRQSTYLLPIASQGTMTPIPSTTTRGTPTSSTTPPTSKPKPSGVPGDEALPVDCRFTKPGSSIECDPIVVRSNGTAPLVITRVDGPTSAAFVIDTTGCVGKEKEKELAPGQTCEIPLVFQPPDTGDPNTDSRGYSDEIVIHQNIPSPDTGTRVILTGTTIPS
jgi:hypothetical protein